MVHKMNKFAGVQLPKSMVDQVPEGLSGIYILYEYENATRRNKRCFYIGESEDIRIRLKEHLRSNSRYFDSFSYCRFHPSRRSFLEQFMIKSLDFLPSEKMNVGILNEKYEIDEPQFVNGSKENPRFKSSEI